MFKKLFKNKTDKKENNEEVLTCALLIHASKMDEQYTVNEKEIIKKALKEIYKKNDSEVIKIMELAEVKEQQSNQILEFTKEIKNSDMKHRIKIIEILWSIVYSDGKADMYESTLMRRICGLLYVSDKASGEIKEKFLKK